MQAAALRELFWQNVVREILTSLSMASAQRMAAGGADVGAPAEGAPEAPGGTGAEEPAAGDHIEAPRAGPEGAELLAWEMHAAPPGPPH
jgi:hypothetical protein